MIDTLFRLEIGRGWLWVYVKFIEFMGKSQTENCLENNVTVSLSRVPNLSDFRRLLEDMVD